MFKVLTIFGTRPELIKMAPVIKELDKNQDKIKNVVCTTAQHRDMITPLLDFFNIQSDYDLNIMQENQTLEDITTNILLKLKSIICKERPDYVLVQGDTTTSMAAGLSAFYNKIKVVHVEAGLRTNDKYQPYPEEVNRKIIDSLCDLYFVHTQKAKNNLIKEGVLESKIEITGNTVIDALLNTAEKDIDLKDSSLCKIPFDDKKIILVTAHRRENFGKPLNNICDAIKDIALKYKNNVCVVYPVHPNPNVKEPVYNKLAGLENVFLIEPLNYPIFVQLMKRSFIILSDSGGIQEEAPSLNKPVLVLRKETERQEALDAGATLLAGTEKDNIVALTTKLFEEENFYVSMAKAENPYGDGKAAERIVARLINETKAGKS